MHALKQMIQEKQQICGSRLPVTILLQVFSSLCDDHRTAGAGTFTIFAELHSTEQNLICRLN
jgi:hypothetical protein